MEPNLEEIKTKITAQTRSHYSVKTFQFVARDGYIEENGIKLQAKDYVESKINDFLQSLDCCIFVDVKFQVIKNFLPMTTSGEFEEVWYVIICYE